MTAMRKDVLPYIGSFGKGAKLVLFADGSGYITITTARDFNQRTTFNDITELEGQIKERTRVSALKGRSALCAALNRFDPQTQTIDELTALVEVELAKLKGQ